MSLFRHTPQAMKNGFIEAFKTTPKKILGLTRTHLVIHLVKICEKYGISALLVALLTATLGFGMLPVPVLWVVFSGSVAYLGHFAFMRFKPTVR